MPLERRDGQLCGPGTLDMKVGVAMGLLATRAVFETLRPAAGPGRAARAPPTKKRAARTSRALIEAEALASDAVLVLEPALAGGPLKTSRKGIGQYHLAVTGVAGARRRRSGQGRERRFASWRARFSRSRRCTTSSAASR